MKVLFDHNLDQRLRRHLSGHVFTTTREMRWETLSNGILLKAAADAGFDAMLCIDKKIEYEQNLKKLPIPVIILNARSNALPRLIPFASHVQKLLESSLERSLYVVSEAGDVLCVTMPRSKPPK